MITRNIAVAAAAMTVAATASVAVARDTVSIVGSSTVYPFATVVAEEFGKKTQFNTPKIESTGTGGGMKLFCAGLGTDHADITNASRLMKSSEREMCESNGVTDIMYVKVGYDGIAFANSVESAKFNLTLEQIWTAMSAHGGMPATWNEVDSSLPNQPISIIVPPPTSGTRDAFAELVLEEACPLEDEDKCAELREDGAVVEGGENDPLLVNKLVENTDQFGIFGYSFLANNADRIQGAGISAASGKNYNVNYADPTIDTIASGDYPIARPLQFYVKAAHLDVIPGMKEFMDEWVEEGTWGPEGYLVDANLVPMPDAEREEFRNIVQNRVVMK